MGPHEAPWGPQTWPLFKLTWVGAEGFQIVDGNRDPLENPFDDNSAIYHPLESANNQSRLAKPELLAHNDQTITRHHRARELNLVKPPESDHGIP